MKLHWLEHKPNDLTGVTWGTPWEKGLLDRKDSVALFNSKGEQVEVQSWPLSYWPDGSVKWTGHAAIVDGSSTFELKVEKKQQIPDYIRVTDEEDVFKINNGCISCSIPKQGNHLIQQLSMGEQIIAYAGKLIFISEHREEKNGETIIRQKKLESQIKSVTLEQAGPIRAVIKAEGFYYGHRNKFPFVIRLYFYANLPDIKIVHTFIYDGEESCDFIKGLGLEMKTVFSGDAWNRTVQIAGDEGMYVEPGQLLLTRRFKHDHHLYAQQIAGETIEIEELPGLHDHASKNAKWNDFKIIQDSANHYKIVKRTEQGCSWVESIHGRRAQGLMYAGGINGGLAYGIKNFWQKYPSALEVKDLTKDESTVNIWLWSPDSQPMDFRHYSKETHVLSAYEGFDEMRATANGIANTSEIYLSCFHEPPTSQQLEALVENWQEPALLVCAPEYYYETNTLGVWSLPNDENSFTHFLEVQLNQAFEFYKKEMDQRSWYGFWNYGDVMHTYDPIRHQWCYDLGGYAWQNTELVPNIWLWYMFLRTGRPDVFKMAEAMTRHTSEVDCYHRGEYAGLGSRHNVVHWGCGCKEVRMSMAGLHKYYYYLTADERIGDLLTEVRDADVATVKLDPMREFYPKDQHPTHVRVGPDWAAFCSNWLTEWERTENKIYRDKILTGINDLKRLPFRLLSGPTFGYDPETSHLHHMGDGNSGGYHMVIAFGAPQVWMELAQLLADDEWEEMIAEFGAFYALTDEEKREESGGILHNQLFSWPMFSGALVAYAANKRQDQKLAAKAWKLLLDETYSYTPLPIEEQAIFSYQELKEIPWITTNTISQWCLNTIVCLELIGKMLPEKELQESVIKQKSVN